MLELESPLYSFLNEDAADNSDVIEQTPASAETENSLDPVVFIPFFLFLEEEQMFFTEFIGRLVLLDHD